jgi:alpha-beta hydrolase superfamily lysophospholipase
MTSCWKSRHKPRRRNALPEPVTFQSDGLTLTGVVHLPDDLKPGERRPAIIVMHGFGGTKAVGPEWLCRQCTEWGYVALRFDFRGCGESEGERGHVVPLEEVADALNAVTYMTARKEVDPGAIALCGSSLGGGVAVQAAAADDRVAAVIVENAVANGERVIHSMHSPESWQRFLGLMEQGIRHRERTGEPMMIHRFDIFEMPKPLQANLASQNALMKFTAETALGFFTFRPEEVVAKIGPRPLLLLHSVRDEVTNYEEAFSLVRMAKPSVELHLLDGTDHFMFVNTDPRVTFTLKNWLDRYFPAQ